MILSFSCKSATLTNKLNSGELLETTAARPMVPILVKSISPTLGLHRFSSSLCSSLEIYFVFEKSISFSVTLVTLMKFIPSSV